MIQDKIVKVFFTVCAIAAFFLPDAVYNWILDSPYAWLRVFLMFGFGVFAALTGKKL